MKLIFKLSLWLGIGLVCFPGGLSFVGAGNTVFAFELDADKVPWSHLSYRAKSLFGTLTTDVGLRAASIKDAAGLLIKDPAGKALQPSGPTLYNLSVRSTINPLFGSTEILRTTSWLNADDARALQRVRLRQGKDRWQKSYRFTKSGVFRLRKEPNVSREEKLPPEKWTKTKTSFYPFNVESLGCSAVLEPSSLFMIASSLQQIQPDLPLYLCVFNKKQVHQVKVFVDGTRRLKVNFLETSTGRQVRREHGVDAVKISFQPHALPSNSEDQEAFSLMGLKGNFDIYVDPQTCLPVQVSGKISTIGKLDIRLVEVHLKKEKN